jgi:hypothetical protein
MCFVERNHKIQTLAANRSQQSFQQDGSLWQQATVGERTRMATYARESPSRNEPT